MINKIHNLANQIYSLCTVDDQVLHIKHVRKFAEKLEKELDNDRDKELLMLSAILHDLGMVKQTSKVVESELHGFKDEVFEMVIKRLEHGTQGSIIARRILDVTAYDDYIKDEVCDLVRCHDDHKLEKYGITIKNPCNKQILQLLREADQLWMLTHDGIRIDQERAKKKDIQAMSDSEQIKHNLKIIGNNIKSKTGKKIKERLVSEYE